MRVQARFFVNKVTKMAGNDNVIVEMKPALRGEHNKDWQKYTPSGSIEMYVTASSPAGSWFESMLGKDVAITFEEREDSEITDVHRP